VKLGFPARKAHFSFGNILEELIIKQQVVELGFG
jgi:hypothetical protein